MQFLIKVPEYDAQMKQMSVEMKKNVSYEVLSQMRKMTVSSIWFSP